MISTRAQKKYLRWLTRSSRFLGMVVISESLRQAYLEQFDSLLHEPDIMAIHDGIDLERFDDMPSKQEARDELGLCQERFIAGYVGHLYPGRGVEQILELAIQLPETHFLFVGGAPSDIAERKQQAENAGLNNVEFAGFVANSELPTYYSACDTLLMPYQHEVSVSGGGNTASYMSPMKMFEYMATGRTIIASDLPVLREVLDESNAALCNPDDISDWRDALLRAKTDLAWSEKLAVKSLGDVEKFTWKRRVSNILESMTVSA